MFDPQTSNIQRYIVEAGEKLKQAKRRLTKIKKQLNSANKLSQKKAFKLGNARNKCHRSINQLPQKIAAWEKLLADNKIKVCFGSRALFKKQHELEANGYETHDQWLNDFRAARSDEFFSLGAKDENNGNLSCQLTKDESGEYSLNVRMLNGLEDQFGKLIVINNLNFPYKADLVDKAVAANTLRKVLSKDLPALLPRHKANIVALKKQQAESIERLMEQGACESKITDVLSKQASKLAKFENETSNNLLTDFGQAMTYRFKRDRKGWRIILSISLENEVNYVTSTANGTIGVDLNEHHISYTEINSRGNKVATDDVYFRDKNYDDTSPQVTTGLGEAVKVLIERAKLSKAPIVIERLDFKKSKSKLKAGQDKKFNKTISSLVTKKFKDILKARCAESSIELISVNPAYTSLIGRLKYANQFDNNVHQAAAMVIARRGAGFLDRKLPKFTMCVVSNKSKYFRIPEDCGEIDISSFFRKVRQQYDTWFLQTLAIIRATRTAPTQRIVLEDINF